MTNIGIAADAASSSPADERINFAYAKSARETTNFFGVTRLKTLSHRRNACFHIFILSVFFMLRKSLPRNYLIVSRLVVTFWLVKIATSASSAESTQYKCVSLHRNGSNLMEMLNLNVAYIKESKVKLGEIFVSRARTDYAYNYLHGDFDNV